MLSPPPIERRSIGGPYGLHPVLSAPIVFVILFGISALLHFAQNLRYRQLWLTLFTFGCICEATGHALRIYGHFHPYNVNAYIAMQCIIVLTPAFFAALDFAILAKLATVFPKQYSLVNPKWILPFFVGLDFASLAVQGGGAGVAASAQAEGSDPNFGGHIVVAGLAIQLFGYIVFDALLFVFVQRCVRNPPSSELWNKRTKVFIAATVVSSALIFARSLFRLIEMSVGWEGVIAKSEWCFYVFDAALVTLAVFIFNVFYPAVYLPGDGAGWNSSEGDDVEGKAAIKREQSSLKKEESLASTPKSTLSSEIA